MGSNNINFKSFGGSESPPLPLNNGLPGNPPLTRQPSVYSLTLDELQSTMGGLGKDLGSMNMDELLKNIWSAEENKFMTSVSSGHDPVSNLQRQGSLTLPRTLSQKTVDEVWKGISKELSLGKDAGGVGEIAAASVVPQRQQTLGEITLEEFLLRARVVREDALFSGKPGDGGFLGDLMHIDDDTRLGVPQLETGPNLMGMRNSESNGLIPIQPSNLPQNLNGVRPNQQPLVRSEPQILPKITAKSPFNGLVSSQGLVGGMPDQVVSNNLAQSGALQNKRTGMLGLGAAPIVGPSNSPANPVSSDGMARSNGNSLSVSPVPYVFNGGIRGRKCSATVEKVVERRQRRMIKNRESAARSRARKQAYTMELEAEVAKLKEENQKLRKKEAEIMQIQKNQVVEMMNIPRGMKCRFLRRTQTGLW